MDGCHNTTRGSAPAKRTGSAMAKRGRPTAFTKKLAGEICAKLADGETLREVCRAEDMPPESTVRRWALEDFNGFAAQYARAREIGYHAMADELVEIADDGSNDWMARNGDEDDRQIDGEHLGRSRLRVDTRKWLLSKALPKVYGDKLDLNHGGEVKFARIERRIVSPDN